MSSRLRAAWWSGVIVGGLVVSLQAQSAPGPATGATAPASANRPNDLAGTWTYNPTESINAATGRPERAPRGPAARTPPVNAAQPVPLATPGLTPGPMGSMMGESSGTVPPTAFGFARPEPLGPTVAMIQENRSLTRDLMEIPEVLTISVDPQAVTFTDDLQRARTYPVTGERRKYQLGAARFNAVAQWNGSRLEKKIEAADGFRMTETYFLNETARRLFVLLRVGSSRKGAPVMGVNRVYDRLGS